MDVPLKVERANFRLFYLVSCSRDNQISLQFTFGSSLLHSWDSYGNTEPRAKRDAGKCLALRGDGNAAGKSRCDGCRPGAPPTAGIGCRVPADPGAPKFAFRDISRLV